MLESRTTDTRAPGTCRSIASIVGRSVVDGKSVSLDSTTPIKTERVGARSGGASTVAGAAAKPGKQKRKTQPTKPTRFKSPKAPERSEGLPGLVRHFSCRIVQSFLCAGRFASRVGDRIRQVRRGFSQLYRRRHGAELDLWPVHRPSVAFDFRVSGGRSSYDLLFLKSTIMKTGDASYLTLL